MTQSQRSRYLKTGGILALVVFLLFVLAPGKGGVRDFVHGTLGLIGTTRDSY